MSYQKDFIIYNTDYKTVSVTGNWANWAEDKHPLTKIPGLYFIASVPVPYGEKITYKYIIDGQWQVNPEEQTETDESGNVNNVFYVPKQEDLKESVVGSTGNPAEQPITKSTSGTLPAAAAAAPIAAVTPAVAGSSSTDAAPAAATTTNVEKVAPGVVEATPAGTGTSVSELAKPDGPVKTTEKPTIAGEATGVPLAAVAPSAAAAAVASPATSASTTGDDLRPAPTTDAPVVPGTEAKGVEGQGLFTALGSIGATAVAAASSTIHNFIPGSTSPTKSADTELPKTATQTPAPGVTGTSASVPTVPSGEKVAAEVKASPEPTAEVAKSPAAALAPISTSDTTSSITKDVASIDLGKTKQEVVNAVEKLGGTIAGGLASIGAAHEGRDVILDGVDTKRGAADSTAPTSTAPAAAATTTTGANGVASTTDAATLPKTTTAAEAKDSAKEVLPAAPVAGAASTDKPKKKSSVVDTITKKDSKSKKDKKDKAATSATAATATTPASTVSKKDASALGVGQAPIADAKAALPSTPKKGSVAAAATPSSTAKTPASPATNDYKTAPSTPSGTPLERKRKTSFFAKVKHALSPSK